MQLIIKCNVIVVLSSAVLKTNVRFFQHLCRCSIRRWRSGGIKVLSGDVGMLVRSIVRTIVVLVRGREVGSVVCEGRICQFVYLSADIEVLCQVCRIHTCKILLTHT